MIETIITLDSIKKDGCSVLTERFYDGEIIGQLHRCSYMNSNTDRKRLKQDYPDYFKALELSVWGKTPTVEEEPIENQ